jgi:hypothetical protein
VTDLLAVACRLDSNHEDPSAQHLPLVVELEPLRPHLTPSAYHVPFGPSQLLKLIEAAILVFRASTSLQVREGG